MKHCLYQRKERNAPKDYVQEEQQTELQERNASQPQEYEISTYEGRRPPLTTWHSEFTGITYSGEPLRDTRPADKQGRGGNIRKNQKR